MAEEIIVQNAEQVKEIDYRRSVIDIIDNNQAGGIEEIKTQLDDISSSLEETNNTDMISAQNEDIIIMVQQQSQRISNIEAKLDTILNKISDLNG